jgi:hypothetical protein
MTTMTSLCPPPSTPTPQQAAREAVARWERSVMAGDPCAYFDASLALHRAILATGRDYVASGEAVYFAYQGVGSIPKVRKLILALALRVDVPAVA